MRYWQPLKARGTTDHCTYYTLLDAQDAFSIRQKKILKDIKSQLRNIEKSCQKQVLYFQH